MTQQLTENFTTAEFTCKCGCGLCDVDIPFVLKLQLLRTTMGFPLEVTSGCRCAARNAAEGGAKNSAHLVGKAADIKLGGPQAAKLVAEAIKAGFTGIGVKQHGSFPARFIHLDTGHDALTMWTYP